MPAASAETGASWSRAGAGMASAAAAAVAATATIPNAIEKHLIFMASPHSRRAGPELSLIGTTAGRNGPSLGLQRVGSDMINQDFVEKWTSGALSRAGAAAI